MMKVEEEQNEDYGKPRKTIF